MAGRFNVKRLISSGLITNYYCTSRCRHCLYNCSPHWPKEYITADTAQIIFQTIKSLSCDAVHIGGGEPLLRPYSLMAVLDVAASAGVHIDYVETNSSWYRDPDSATEVLSQLKQCGLQTLLISISPFHNEHIPFAKVNGVMTAARNTGIRMLLWVDGFLPDLTALDPQHTHAMAEFETEHGRDYLLQVLRRYWIHLGGRALDTFRSVLREKPLEQIINEGDTSCTAELSDTNHFPIDLFGNLIPGLCAGLAISHKDLDYPLHKSAYPLLHQLYSQGIQNFYRWARKSYNFRPARRKYLNKCDLCTEIRAYLVENTGEEFAELKPLGFYTQK